MGLILVVLLLALVFGGLGFVFPILWGYANGTGFCYVFVEAIVALTAAHSPIFWSSRRGINRESRTPTDATPNRRSVCAATG
jgi:hypothetical protein